MRTRSKFFLLVFMSRSLMALEKAPFQALLKVCGDSDFRISHKRSPNVRVYGVAPDRKEQINNWVKENDASFGNLNSPSNIEVILDPADPDTFHADADLNRIFIADRKMMPTFSDEHYRTSFDHEYAHLILKQYFDDRLSSETGISNHLSELRKLEIERRRLSSQIRKRNNDLILKTKRNENIDLLREDIRNLEGKREQLDAKYNDLKASLKNAQLAYPNFLIDASTPTPVLGLHEYFSDLFAVVRAKNPKAMMDSNLALHKARRVSGVDESARDFSVKDLPENWEDLSIESSQGHNYFWKLRNFIGKRYLNTEPYLSNPSLLIERSAEVIYDVLRRLHENSINIHDPESFNNYMINRMQDRLSN